MSHNRQGDRTRRDNKPARPMETPNHAPSMSANRDLTANKLDE
jgi:hypothetical protein